MNILLMTDDNANATIATAFNKRYAKKYDIQSFKANFSDARTLSDIPTADVYMLFDDSQSMEAAIRLKNVMYALTVRGALKLVYVNPVAEKSDTAFIDALVKQSVITSVIHPYGVFGAGMADDLTKLLKACAKGKKKITVKSGELSFTELTDVLKVCENAITDSAKVCTFSAGTLDTEEIVKRLRRIVRMRGGDFEYVVKGTGNYAITGGEPPIKIADGWECIKRVFDDFDKR